MDDAWESPTQVELGIEQRQGEKPATFNDTDFNDQSAYLLIPAYVVTFLWYPT